MAAGSAAAPYLRGIRGAPPRLPDRGVPGRGARRRRGPVGLCADQLAARAGGGGGRLGAVGGRPPRVPARHRGLRRSGRGEPRAHARSDDEARAPSRHPPAAPLARPSAVPVRGPGRPHGRPGLAARAGGGGAARAPLRAAGVRGPDGGGRPAGPGLPAGGLRAPARRHAGGHEPRRLGPLARRHARAGCGTQCLREALRPRDLRARLLGGPLAPGDPGDRRAVRSGAVHVREQLPDREAVDDLRRGGARHHRVPGRALGGRAARGPPRHRTADRVYRLGS